MSRGYSISFEVQDETTENARAFDEMVKTIDYAQRYMAPPVVVLTIGTGESVEIDPSDIGVDDGGIVLSKRAPWVDLGGEA